MRFFPDTNVLVSALVARGLCADLLRQLVRGHRRGHWELLVGTAVEDEVERVLRDKLQADRATLALARAFLSEGHRVEGGAHPAALGVPDPGDVAVVANALVALADVFITGDKALLEVAKIERMAFASPRQAWAILARLGK